MELRRIHRTENTTSSPIKPIKTINHFSGDWTSGDGLIPCRETLGPLFIIASSPLFVVIHHFVTTKLEGNFIKFAQMCHDEGFWATVYGVTPSCMDPTAWKLIGCFMAFNLLLMRVVPGREFKATTTANGHQPTYKANGTACYLINIVTLMLLSRNTEFRPAIVYDKFGELMMSMNLFATVFCILLVIKGHVAPSGLDSGSSGNLVTDFYWGMELYPRILGWDLKMFTNCRVGMMFWAIGVICYAHKNMEVNEGSVQLGMLVNVGLQLIYVTKFFHWEMGYMCSMDIQHDHAGFYICWGCLVWVPSIYTSNSFYLAEHAPELSPALALALFLVGVLMVYINYDSDRQRYIFRQTNGECTIWGKKPSKIVAEYTTTDGRRCKSLLLVGGWWKVSRHFHYMPEILVAVCWSLPALNSALIAPYFYVLFLTILLVDRAFRDDDRCHKKYGRYWEAYCKEVPYKIVPFIV